MEALIPTMVGAFVFCAAVLATLGRRRARLRGWSQAAAVARLDDVRVSDKLGQQFVEGRADGLRVRLEGYYQQGRYESGTRVTIEGLGPLSIRREGASTALGKRLLGQTEVELGDAAFDAQCFVDSPAALAFAVLTPPARRELADALAGRLGVDGQDALRVRVRLAGGKLSLECRDGWFGQEQRVRDLLLSSLRLARLLVRPPDVPLRIAENLKSEPEPGVRLAAIATLAREYPRNPATREALLAALRDAEPEVRLRAAIALGKDGHETLRSLVMDASTEDALAARAVGALGEHLAESDAAQTLRQALDVGRTATVIACLESLGQRSTSASEPTVLAALWSDGVAVRAAAARALGHVGSAAAVRELLAIINTGPSELRGAARQAIAEIQSRLPGAGPGQLSLAGGEAGALSLADDQTGRLSLAEEGAARLPIAEDEQPARALAAGLKEKA